VTQPARHRRRKPNPAQPAEPAASGLGGASPRPSSRIAGIEVRSYAFPLDPPFRAAWDPVPREALEASLVIVRSDDGLAGYASGDRLPEAALLERLLVGLDPLRTEVVRELCETVDFHGSRPWTAEVAVWDLAARALDVPLWRLLGGRSERLLAYASSGELADAGERARRVVALRDRGVKAVKLRLHGADWRRGVELVERVRDAVGADVELMVDANQGWRMAGDREARWDVATASQCARALEPIGIYWLEEPLATGDVDGYATLRRRTSLRIAAGEMVRGSFEASDLMLRGGVDVIQPDAVLAGGLGGCRRIAALADLRGRTFTPHTWSNGLGLLANLHLALAVSTCPFVEVPLDPPAWTPDRRDWLLPAPLEIAADGTIAPPPGPGLGVSPDLDALEAYRVG
jgi:D-galactarolactone cycloisomerase